MSKAPITEDQIAEAAFYIWLEEGQPEGRDLDHWVKAKKTLEGTQSEVKKRPAKPRAKAAAATKPATTTKAPAKKAAPRRKKAEA